MIFGSREMLQAFVYTRILVGKAIQPQQNALYLVPRRLNSRPQLDPLATSGPFFMHPNAAKTGVLSRSVA